jgi:nucleoid-associated protein YgaU
MRRRRVTTTAAVGAAALLLVGCRPIAAQSSQESTVSSSKNGATARSVQKVYVVQRGDTLSAIAQRECGDGSSVTTLAKANIGRKQADGTVMKDADQLRVGWKIVVAC